MRGGSGRRRERSLLNRPEGPFKPIGRLSFGEGAPGVGLKVAPERNRTQDR
jgi:hypothetical protein